MKVSAIFLGLTAILLVISNPGFSQRNKTFSGILMEAERYEQVEEVDDDTYGFVGELPASSSLRKYAPPPWIQTGSSCVGWSIGYSAMSIMYNLRFGADSENELFWNVFDPYYLYSLLRMEGDFDCEQGTYMGEALDLLMQRGCKKMMAPPLFECGTEIIESILMKSTPYASSFIIADAFSIQMDYEDKVGLMKELIADGYALPIGMNLPASFEEPEYGGIIGKDGIYDPSLNDTNRIEGGHAMTVIGYDDN
ncbi:MAG: hypothetical protein IIA45_15770, partial [Bacteroidetes bacterium]|nr:hypothetical protein [Bacteroidota bacterium]